MLRGVFLLLLSLPCVAAPVMRVAIDSVVHPVTTEIVREALAQARTEDASLVLVRLNTPGGLIAATRDVVELLIGSPVPVVTYVAPSGARAASAGFFLLMSGDVAAMAPGTNTGASSPVMMGREIDPVMRKKIESDTAAWLRSLTARRGRNAKLAETTVLEARSFTEEEALKENLIDLIAASEAELLQKLNGREITTFTGQKQTLQTAGALIRDYELTLRQKILRALSNPNIAFILVILGILGLYVEFSAPGAIVPGVAGAILLLLGLTGLSVLPINWIGAALILLALVLFVAEAFFTSYGILGAGGAIALVAGAMLLVKGPPELRIAAATAIGVALPFALISVFLMSLVVKAHKTKTDTGPRGLIGATGIARTALSPGGQIFVRGEYWAATCSVPVPEGTRVRVLAVEGLLLLVEPAS